MDSFILASFSPVSSDSTLRVTRSWAHTYLLLALWSGFQGNQWPNLATDRGHQKEAYSSASHTCKLPIFRQKISPAEVQVVTSLLLLPLNNFIIFLRKIPLYRLSGWMIGSKVSTTLPTSPSGPSLSAVAHGAQYTAIILPRSWMTKAGHRPLWPSHVKCMILFLFSCKKRQPLIVYETHKNSTLHKIPIRVPTFCIDMHGFQGSHERIAQAQAVRHDEVQVTRRHYSFLNGGEGAAYGWVLWKDNLLMVTSIVTGARS